MTSPNITRKSQGFLYPIPFVEFLGFNLTQFENGLAEIKFDLLPEHLNTLDFIHGGVLMTLMDVAMAAVARSVDPLLSMITIELKTTFMQPAMGEVITKGRLIHKTASTAFSEASIFDMKNKHCAHATGTFRYVHNKNQANLNKSASD
ncbi:MAG: PaaI family thioesterase [Limnohabitans sp.]|nr:PaaI family thioesterase [Limnohabitans sp.]